MATTWGWSYRHKPSRDRERPGVQVNPGWSGGMRDRPDVFALTLRDTESPDAHGCAALFQIRLSREEAVRLHARLGAYLAEHPERPMLASGPASRDPKART